MAAQNGSLGQSLIDSAKACELELRQLKQNAEDKKTGRLRHANTTKLLGDTSARSGSDIVSLEVWIANVSSGGHTSDDRVIKQIEELFALLRSQTVSASKALDRRLALRLRRYIPGQKSRVEEKLNQALSKIHTTIGYLHSHSTIVLANSREQKELKERIRLVRGRPPIFNDFLQEIERMSFEEKRVMRFGDLQMLWERVPGKQGTQRQNLEGCIGNADDPGDGIVYSPSEVGKAESVLKAFCDAWWESAKYAGTVPESNGKKVGTLVGMPKICLILSGMNQQRLLDFFYDHSTTDMNLPISEERLHNMLPKEDAPRAAIFYAEQFRAIARPWPDGEQLTVEKETEPLPLERIKLLGKGGYGEVWKCKHAFDGTEYAQKIHPKVQNMEHLETEIKLLKKLDHNHIIRLAKWWRRGENCGILLQPVATTDLQRLLRRYKHNGYSTERHSQDRRKDRNFLRPFILNAFGCLSRGLLHIHRHNIRHKDIKLSNILFDQKPGQAAKFLWADFGLAYDFSGKDHSREPGSSKYTPRYAAPEVVESAEALKKGQQLDNLHLSQGRASDIFSFGCVFLEILSYLIDELDGDRESGGFEKCSYFHAHVDSLQAWAKKQVTDLPKEMAILKPLFNMAIKMVSTKQGDRPTIDKVVTDLESTSASYFCTACRQEPDMTPQDEHIEKRRKVEGSTRSGTSKAREKSGSRNRLSWSSSRARYSVSGRSTPSTPGFSSSSSSLFRKQIDKRSERSKSEYRQSKTEHLLANENGNEPPLPLINNG